MEPSFSVWKIGHANAGTEGGSLKEKEGRGMLGKTSGKTSGKKAQVLVLKEKEGTIRQGGKMLGQGKI